MRAIGVVYDPGYHTVLLKHNGVDAIEGLFDPLFVEAGDEIAALAFELKSLTGIDTNPDQWCLKGSTLARDARVNVYLCITSLSSAHRVYEEKGFVKIPAMTISREPISAMAKWLIPMVLDKGITSFEVTLH